MEADLLVRGGFVIDGTGAPARRADVAIAAGRIAAVGQIDPAGARATVDVGGLTVTPGFIDMHSHSDYTLFGAPAAESRIGQGITTEVFGNCGYSPAPLPPGNRDAVVEWSGSLSRGLPWDWTTMADFLASLERMGTGTNVLALVGHGAVRVAAMGFARRAPTGAELDQMRALVADAMRDGAWGLSTGLIYPPATYCETDEVIALARVAARYGGRYFTHMRDEADGLFDAVREALRIGREGGLPVQISHLKAAGQRQWGRMGEVVSLVEEARASGQDVWADFYPYEAGGTFLYGILPPFLMEGGIDGLVGRAGREDVRAQVKDAIKNGVKGWWNPVGVSGGWSEVTIVDIGSRRNKPAIGRTVHDLAASRGQDPVDTALDLLVEERGAVQIVIRMMRQGDIETVARTPWAMMGTDGEASSPREAEEHLVHPRAYGTTARFLGDYVRDRGLTTWEAAVHRMTGLPAERMGLADRGTIAPGQVADLVVLEPERVADVASYAQPHKPPQGFQHVFVHGEAALRDGTFTGSRSGKVLRRSHPAR